MLPRNSQARSLIKETTIHFLVLGFCLILFLFSALEGPEVFISQRLLIKGLRGQFVFCV